MAILKGFCNTKTIGAAKFKEQCLALLDQLDVDGLVVTKQGKPIARIIPYDQHSADLIDSTRDRVKIRGNLFTTGVRWEADP